MKVANRIAVFAWVAGLIGLIRVVLFIVYLHSPISTPIFSYVSYVPYITPELKVFYFVIHSAAKGTLGSAPLTLFFAQLITVSCIIGASMLFAAPIAWAIFLIRTKAHRR